MKIFRSRLAIILAITMVLTSFSFLGVYAEEESQTIADVTGLTAYSSSEAVVFLWNKVADADGYIVDGTAIPSKEFDVYKNGQIRYNKTGLGEDGATFIRVQAYKDIDTTETNEDGEETTVKKRIVSTNVAADSDRAVRTIRYRVRIKKGGTLKAHGGNGPSSIQVYKGEYIDCYGFGGGKYIFNRNGSIFYCNKSRTNKRSCVYNSGATYSPQEAEFFVNMYGLGSSTGKLVWVNTYTQTIYMFSGSACNWTCDFYGKCSTGKAASPTPTGVTGIKKIWKKIAKRHGIKYWSPFSEINSIHSKKSKWRLGYHASNGCVRNYIENAYRVYTEAPIGTTVFVY